MPNIIDMDSVTQKNLSEFLVGQDIAKTDGMSEDANRKRKMGVRVGLFLLFQLKTSYKKG